MRILVIRRDNIGDLACTTPLLDGLRRAQPCAWIGVLANTYNAEVLARNPAVDAVFGWSLREDGLMAAFSRACTAASLSWSATSVTLSP